MNVVKLIFRSSFFLYMTVCFVYCSTHLFFSYIYMHSKIEMYNAIIMYKLINLSIIYYVLINVLYKSRCSSKNYPKETNRLQELIYQQEETS